MAIIGNPIIAAVKTEVDPSFDEYSTNPVQNRVIAAWTKEPELTLYQDEETKLVYISTLDGVLLGDGILVEGGGGGGGGGGSTYTVKLINLSESRDIVVAQGASAVLAFRYTSIDDDGVDDGPGVGTITVNGVQAARFAVQQGENVYDVSSLIGNGTSTVIVRAENSEGLSKTLKYTVSVVTLSLTTTINELASYTGELVYYYTVTGAGTKTMHFVMDGVEIGTDSIPTSNRSQSFTIPAQSYGGHVFEAYATMNASGMNLRSNTLRHSMLWLDGTSSTPAISSTFNVTEATEGEILTMPYIVYDPLQENAPVTLTIFSPNGNVYSTQTITVDRTPHSWSFSDYPSGNIRVRLSSGNAYCEFPIAVAAHELPVSEITDGLVLKFDASGRSNGEENPAQWSYEGITASFSGFGWRTVDGWVYDDEGANVLRFLPGDTMTIPFKPFMNDVRTNGLTVEVEMATRDVRDYESVVLSCMNGGRGFRIASQEAELTSEQSSVSMLFKEDAKVRVTFSVENRNLNRLVYIYINGIMCGVTQYPVDDNFQQASPAGITIGAQSCGLDLYKIRIYNKGLTRAEQLDNFIIDRPTLTEREDAVSRNDILNDSDETTVSKLPAYLPYMIVKLTELPQYKGDKKGGVEVTFVDQLNPERSWTATGVEMDVQGTSSQGYPVKNYKIKLKNGITYTNATDEEGNPLTDRGFPIHVGELPTKTICFKADYASSENANNVVLAQLYNDIAPYQTPPQEEDERVRQGIDGFGIALFWQDANNVVTFLGKGNCNVDKGNENIFGFTDDYPNCESWEFKNNTSNRVLFKSADFSGSGWLTDFEARYPDTDPAYEDPTRLQRVFSWVVSTDRDAVNSAADKAARLQKFVNEFEQYFIKDAMLFMYLFTEAFLMVDNRAKNMFLTTYDGTHWFDLPYDFDTAIGINNEGALTFPYQLEDIDHVGTADVYNGQYSVLWCNIRDGFRSELAAMYRELRTMTDPDGTAGSPFSYAKIAKRFTEHQKVWPEAMWNEDAFIKYLQPFLTANENYLAMLQGNKASQRDWWLFNRFRYLDSKYKCGDAQSNFITLRCYTVGNITLTPYSDIYARVKYGSDEGGQVVDDVSRRVSRNQSIEMVCSLDQMNDTEVYIYSSDRISSVGDLSPLQVGLANFSMAPKLTEIKLGDEDPEYENTRLGAEASTFNVGSNELLETVNIANCTALGTGTQKSVDLSGCSSLKTVIATGTALRGITFPNGGHLTTLKLPSTLTNFTVMNQANLQTPVFEDYGNLETLRVENTPNIPIEDLILENPNLNRLRLIDVEWTATDAEALQDMYDRLTAVNAQGNRIIGGIDASGMNTATAVISGIVSVSETVQQTLLDAFMEDFPDLTIVANGHATLTVRFRDWDGTLLNTQTCDIGGSVTDPVAAGTIQTPTREPADKKFFTYSGWDKALTNITHNMIVTAVYAEEMGCEVRFVNDTQDEALLYTAIVRNGSTAPDPVALGYINTPTKPTDEQYSYTYIGWQSTLNNITEDKTIKARYTTEVSVCVIFVNWDETELCRKYIERGSNVVDPITAGDIQTPTRPDDTVNKLRYMYSGWDKSLNGILESTTITAQFSSVLYYIITFVQPQDAGGATLYTTTVNRNGRVIDPVQNGDIQTPTRTPGATYNYVYKGWDAVLSQSVQQDYTYTAVYRTDQQFVVRFVDWDGTILDTQLVEDESDAVEPIAANRIQTPIRSSTAQYTYAFSGWSGVYTFITQNTDITAQYTSTVRTYTYRFLNNDNTVLKSGTVNYGTTVTAPSNPSYVPANEDMEFTGWSPNSLMIVANTDFIAQYLDNSSMTVKYLKGTLKDYESDTATKVAKWAFDDSFNLETVRTSATTIEQYAFRNCANLRTVDLTSTSGGVSIGDHAFESCSSLTHLIIRSSSVAFISLNNALNRTLIAAGRGAVYVPAELVEEYKASTNWSVYAKCIYPISAYPVTDFSTINDSWSEIFAAEDNGTYSTKYHIGDTKQLSVNGETMYVQIAAMDADTLSGGGTAKITWVLESSMSTYYSMNPIGTNDGGWPETTMRVWLRDTILPTIDSVVRTNIKTVSKTSYNYGTSTDIVTDETIWLPSMREVFNAASYESSGPIYSDLFNSAENRRKYREATVELAPWALRSTHNNNRTQFCCVGTDGAVMYQSANGNFYIAFGFCT